MSSAARERPAPKSALGRQRSAGPRPTPDYVMDANYYRLAYQLLAQSANDAVASKAAHDTVRASANGAEHLLGDIDRVLSWLEQRQLQGRAPWRSGLSVQEARLQLFLAGTVEPCTLLIIAARSENLAADPLELVGFEAGRRMRVTFKGLGREAHASEIPWSYRAYYNLACCYTAGVAALVAPASGGAEDPSEMQLRVGGALLALEKAFRQVHGRPRVELWRWAKRDPSLSALAGRRVGSKSFESVLSDYAPPAVKPTGAVMAHPA